MRVAYCSVSDFERDSSAFSVSRYESTRNSIRVRVSSEGSRLASGSINLDTRSNRARYFA